MIRIGLDLQRTPIHAGNQQVVNSVGQFEVGGASVGLPWNPSFGTNHEGFDGFNRISATADAGDCQRRTHQLHPATTRNPFGKLGRSDRKFSVEELAEILASTKFRKATPVGWLLKLRG